MRLIFSFIFVAVLVLLTCVYANENILTPEEQKFVDKLNELRDRKGLEPVIIAKKMVDDCRQWARVMERTGRFGHAHSWENCAMNSANDGNYTYNQWRNSKGHWAFLNRTSVKYIGIGHIGKHWVYRGIPDLDDYKSGSEWNAQTKQVSYQQTKNVIPQRKRGRLFKRFR